MKTVLKGQLLDYCAACRKDIEQAREHWRTGAEFAEVPRLPQPDPTADVARLKSYNFRKGGEADKLVGYGKAVMPSLVERVQGLPGGNAFSARSYGAYLALWIVIAEDNRRQPPGTPDRAVPDVEEDLSAALLSWWRQESERFMEGDDWSLPPMLQSPTPK